MCFKFYMFLCAGVSMYTSISAEKNFRFKWGFFAFKIVHLWTNIFTNDGETVQSYEQVSSCLPLFQSSMVV